MLDIGLIHSGADTVMTLVSGAPTVDIQFEDDTVEFFRNIAGIVSVMWVLIFVVKSFLPRTGGGMNQMMGGGGGGAKIIAGIFGILCLMDINITVSVADFLMQQIWALKDIVKL